MRTLPSILLLASLFAVVSCGDDQDPAGAKDLLQRVRDEGYTKWARAPGYEDRKTSSAPHGDEVEIFVNEIVAEALAAGESISEWPVGSIVAKDGYTEDGELDLIALMEKRDDGWYWAEYDGDGESIYSGKPSICIDCHASGSDYVRAFSLP